MDRSKVVAIITGAIAVILSIAYLAIVQFLDFRGEMRPAPIDISYHAPLIVTGQVGTLPTRPVHHKPG
ncbi:MAG: hypothetical protein VKJ46_09455 [Leptolyngbyaceae bacterium]|nr:hypothetical protein [Leptolyngbyaceae bacterium]